MWTGKRSAQDRLNDYWNALDRHAPLEELAQLRALLDPELTATIDTTRARFRRLRPDPAFSDRLEGDLMNAFASAAGGSLPLAPARPATKNGKHEPWTPARWIPGGFDRHTNRRGAMVQLGLVALLLLTLIGGYFVYSSRSDHPAIVQEGTPVSTPTQDWTNTRGDAGRTGLGESGPVGQPVTIWKFQAAGPCDTAPAAVGDTVFAACGNGILYAIDRAAGTERWQFSAQAPVIGGPTVLDGIVVLVDVDGRLYGVDAETGEQRWVTEGTFYGAPVAKDGTILVGGFEGQLAAIDLATGEARWRYMVEEGGEAKNPAIGDGIVYSGSIANGFTAVDLQTGELVWHADTGGIETGTAVVANGVAYIGSAPGVPEGFLNAYDAETGDLLWSSDAPIFSPAVKDGAGFAGSADGPVTAIDLANGEILWQVTVGGVARPAVVAGEVVYMNSEGDEAIYAFDTATGDQLWKFPVDGYLGDAPALKDGVLYANTGGGTIYAIGGEHAIPAAGTSAGSGEPAASAAAATAVASPASSAPELLSAELLWSTTGGDGGLNFPGRLAIAPDGTIWVSDNRNHRFQIFDADGNFLETWGSQGSGDGEFQFMTQNQNGFSSIAFLDDGSFYVGDPGNARVQKFGPDRSFEYSIGGPGSGPGQFQLPINVEIGPDGTVWVADDLRVDMQQFGADGTLLNSFSAPEGTIWSSDFKVLENGNFLIGNTVNAGTSDQYFRVLELSPDGTVIRSFGAPDTGEAVFRSQATDIAVDSDGRIFAGVAPEFGGEILVFSPDGTLLATLSSPDFAAGIALDGAGNLYASGYLDGVLAKYRLVAPLADDLNSEPQALWSTLGGDEGFDRPGRVAVAPSGQIWVVDSGNHRFQIFDADGNFLETWGEQGKGDGQFQFLARDQAPFGDIVFAPDGSFFVLDPGNGRVQAFGPDREFRLSFGSFGSGDGQFTVPLDLAIAPDGTLWVTDDKRQDAQQFDQEGNFLSSFDSTAFAGSPQSYWFAWDHRIDADGNHYFTVAGPTTRPSGEPFFNVVVTDAGGTFLRTLGPNPDGTNGFEIELTEMATGPDGNLYAGVGGDGSSVFVFSPDGTLLGEIPTDAQVQGVAFDAAGNLIVSTSADATLSSYRLG